MHEKDNNTEAPSKGNLFSRLFLILGALLVVSALAIACFVIWQYVDAHNRNHQIQSASGFDFCFLQTVGNDTKLEDMRFDWDALRAINPDVVGWIIVPDTNINYPIVQGADNEHYLRHLFDSSYSGAGAIFVDYAGSPTLDGKNNIIYGHNMFDGTMFSDIHLYTNQDFFDGHRVVYLCTPARNFELSAIACINVSAGAPLRQFDFGSSSDFASFVSETLAAPVSVAPDLSTKIVETESLYMFITCETFDFSKRDVLCCVPIRSAVPNSR